MFRDDQIKEIVSVLEGLDSSTKIYLGCDSVRYQRKGRKMARYATVCIIHMNGSKGCKIFSNVSHEADYDVKKNRPKTRMMNEVMKVCQLYTQLIPFIEELAEIRELPDGELEVREFDVEIHLDINTDPKHGSNCAATEAAGYVLAMTGIEPKLKPDAWSASFGADYIANKGSV